MEFKGFPYPVTEHPQGYFHPIGGVDLLKADLLVLLLTNPGERVMHPEYGCDLRSIIFDPNDAATADAARSLVIEAIRRWEPRLTVTAIECEVVPDEGVLKIMIDFRNPTDIAQIERLELEIPAGGS